MAFIEKSLQEKQMMLQILGEEQQPYLPFKLRWHSYEYNGETMYVDQYYIIPMEKKQEVLEQLWIFDPVPSMEDIYWDIHEQAFFKIKAFKVIRWKDHNIMVSPYYFKSGGTILDMVKAEDNDKSFFIGTIRK